MVICCLESRITMPDSPYPGQIALCPSDSQAFEQHPSQSVSTGIVSIHLHNQWGGFGYDRSKPLVDEVTNYRGNLICQQAGFQKVVPGSIRTVAAYKESGIEFTSCTTPKYVVFSGDGSGFKVMGVSG